MPTPTNFAVPVNNASTTLSAAKTTTTLPQTITLTNGAVLPALTGSQKYRVTICQVAFAYSPTATTSNYTVYMADTVSGNNITLESLSTTEGQTQIDRTYAIGDIVEVRVTAGTLEDIHTAVNALETAGAGVTIGNAVSGGTNNSVLYVDSTGNLADSGPTYTITNAGQNLSLIVGVGAANTSAQAVLNYGTAAGANINYSFGGVLQFAFGGNNLAQFGGSTGTNSGRSFYVYDWVLNKYRMGVDQNGTFYFGPSVSNTSLVVSQPNTGVTGSTIRADGSIGLVSLADGVGVANNSLYYSTTSSKLCYKDPAGVLHTLT